MKKLLENDGDILILSGEGEIGTYKYYTGRRTEGSIKNQLQKERCRGDRWAKAYIYSHETYLDGNWDDDLIEKIYIDMETGEYRAIDDEDIL